MNPITEFIDKAKGLTKNPLGIIALFISLIYGFACLVLSSSIDNLCGNSERLPLIWFMIIFPILILIGFIYLVVKHHSKLYAPSDFKEESNFFKGFENGQQVSIEYTPPKTSDDSIDNLLKYGSVKGLYALYAVYLAYNTKMKFNLSDLEGHASLLSEEYTHGFLVGASSLGAFTLTSVEQPFFISSINTKLAERIKDVCYKHAEIDKQTENSDYLYNQLAILEKAFTPKTADIAAES